jgi:hypothetical protein
MVPLERARPHQWTTEVQYTGNISANKTRLFSARDKDIKLCNKNYDHMFVEYRKGDEIPKKKKKKKELDYCIL